MTHQTVEVVAAVITRPDGRVLVTQRFADAHLGGMWEFPGGKPDTGETQREALQRELLEELGVQASICEEIITTEHTYPPRDGRPTKSVRIAFFRANIVSGTPQSIGVQDMRWVEPPELHTLDMPAADRPLIEKLGG
jgi:8-oxo-dGTP diphosphatase